MNGKINSNEPAWIQNSRRFLEMLVSEPSGRYASVRGGEATLYGTCYVSLTQAYLGQSNRAAEATRQFISDCQNPTTGLFVGPELTRHQVPSGRLHDIEHLHWHSTATALPCLLHFGGKPKYPLRAVHPFLDLDKLRQWLDGRDLKNAWFEGNNILFIGQFLVYLRDFERLKEAEAALALWFEWLETNIDPQTNLWGSNGFCSLADAAYGGYHQLLVYYHENFPLINPQGLVDSILSLQHAEGGFDPAGGGGACQDVDCVDILVNLYERYDYRRPEIRLALRRCMRSILAIQNRDGGFPYRRDEIQSHMGIPGTQAGPNRSTTFATWFRVHTLALISLVLTDEKQLQFPFRFTTSLSMGWHSVPESYASPASESLKSEEAFFPEGMALPRKTMPQLIRAHSRSVWVETKWKLRPLKRALLGK